MGDIALCCTPLARPKGQNPVAVAEKIAETLAAHPLISSASAAGPYVNLTLAADYLFGKALNPYSRAIARTDQPQRIMVEYLSPNTNKPLHLGHVRNGVLGASLSNLLEATGHDVIRANLVNDRGVHICKSMLAYERFGNGMTPASAGKKGDHFVGDFYVAYANAEKANPSLKDEVEAMLRGWEAGDPAIVGLWKRMNDWVYEGFASTYARYGFRFDAMYYESNLYRLGKDIVQDGLSKDVFKTLADGSVVFPLPEASYGTNTDGTGKIAAVLRGDGTSVYLTQDIGTAVRKAGDYTLDRSIYVVMSEQTHHFKVLFDILAALGYPWASRCYHFSYEMVELPEGRMKSREGTVVDADDLADAMVSLATEAIKAKQTEALPEEEVRRRSEAIGLAAIKFYLLRFNPQSKVVFDPKHSLSFEGDTGPYCLYAYARIRRLFEKAAARNPFLIVAPVRYDRLGTQEERALARALAEFPEIVTRAAETYAPSLVAEHVLGVARAFSRFYKTQPVLGDDESLTRERLQLAGAAGETIRSGLALLGIEVLESM